FSWIYIAKSRVYNHYKTKAGVDMRVQADLSVGKGNRNEAGAAEESEPSRKLIKYFSEIRSFTEALTDPLENEDFVIQIAEFTSPAKWHLAHTSWFFETFLLKKAVEGYQPVDSRYSYLFNSYYLQTGEPHCRAKRGNLSRPTVRDVFDYRRTINRQVCDFIESASGEELDKWTPVIEIGLNHEQQHQELLLTDLKFMFAQNPLYPAYDEGGSRTEGKPVPRTWTGFEEGIYEIGHTGDGFGYDNEFPRHKVYIHDFELGNRLVTNGEYLEFMKAGGYEDPVWWLDEGYTAVVEEGLQSPLYWFRRDGEWVHYTLGGVCSPDLNEPVSHISYYEADAFARWAGYRLPSEQEWEVAAAKADTISGSNFNSGNGANSANEGIGGNGGHFIEGKRFHPAGPDPDIPGLQQMLGTLWEWTQSSYSAYPGYKPLQGALGEYNGKFMSDKYVLRGGSCVTARHHIRKTYRNFFHAGARWQFSGIRLAR
ncbi:MAG: ergothioneine biosynthesis protein EgtB, partial [Balneolaceae bacterium]